MSRPLLLDLFCGAGGAGTGYDRAGFEVIGVDHRPQPRYPFTFVEHDALIVLTNLVRDGRVLGRYFDAVHASPPCQANSPLRHLWPDREHADLIDQTRELLIATGLPYVIENVPGARARMREPVTLCGSMFGLGAGGRQLRRHRLFECSHFATCPPPLCQHHGQPVGVYGNGGGKSTVRGYKGNAAEYREAMEMPWATKAEIAQAIPPSYTEWIGRPLMSTIAKHPDPALVA